MAWNDAPPTADELKSASSWDATPPTPEELASIGGPSQVEAAINSFGKGATLGYLPQVQAGTEGAIDAIAKKLGIGQYSGNKELAAKGFNVQQQPDTSYVQNRDAYIVHQNELAKAYPKTAIAAELAGNMAATAPIAGMLPVPATTGQALKTGAILGGAQGYVQNPGDVQGVVDPTQIIQRNKNAAIGTALGGTIGAITGKLFTPGGQEATAESAGNMGFHALGPYAKQARQALQRNQVSEIGQEALDKGIIKTIPASPATITQRAEQAAEAAGKAKGDVIDKLAEFEKQAAMDYMPSIRGDVTDGLAVRGSVPSIKSDIAKAGVSRDAMADAMESKMLLPEEVASQSPTLKSNNLKIKDFIDDFRKSGDSIIPLKTADKVKVAVGKEINWNTPPADRTLDQRALIAQYQALNKGVDDSAEALANLYSRNMLGNAPQALSSAKKSYGLLQTAADIANNREARELGKRMVSPSDNAAMATGFLGSLVHGAGAVKAVALGAVGGIANKIGRQYGPQIGAKFLDVVAKTTAGSQITPEAMQLMNSIPQLLYNVPKSQVRLKALEE